MKSNPEPAAAPPGPSAPTPRGDTTARTRETREKVLAVASELMASRGYSGTSISALHRASGVLPASIYWHFGNKEGLAAAVLARAAERWFAALQEGVRRESPGDPEGAPFRSLRETVSADPTFLRLLLLFALERGGDDEAALAELRRVRARVKDFLVDAIEPLLPELPAESRSDIARRLAFLLVALIDGGFVAGLVDAEETERSRLEELAEWSIEAAALRLIEEARTGAETGGAP